VPAQQHDAKAEFHKKWEAEEVSGWEDNKPKAQVNGNGNAGIWCAACTYLVATFAILLSFSLKAKNITRSRRFMMHI
jgi:splicing factor 3A subunit 3